jgi:glycosyltransferase involved in cell wall biosynthesis
MNLTICAPKPDKIFALRKDSMDYPDIICEIGVIRVKVMGRQVNFFRLPSGVRFRDFDLVIIEQSLKNVQYIMLLFWSIKKTKIALWGHGKTIVKKKSKIEEFIQLFLSKRADFFFSYTKEGKKYLVEKGYPKEKSVVLQNSNSSLDRLIRIENKQNQIARNFNNKNVHCCFIGAIEETKGIQFLLNSLPIIKEAIPDFEFTFIGDGPSRELVYEIVKSTDYVNWLGYKNQGDIDDISDNFSLILNPGRVGLIAVDSLMLLLPIVTSHNSYHAPEYEYIKDNGTSIAVNGNFRDYATAIICLLQNPEKIQTMREVASTIRVNYTVEVMVENFVKGINSCLYPGKS